MKLLSEFSKPTIFVDDIVYDKLAKYSKNMDRRGIIVCDVFIDEKNNQFDIFDAFLPEQTVEYSKNSSKFEDIGKHVTKGLDQNGNPYYSHCLIRNNLNSTQDSFTQSDFSYFEKLCDVVDWLIVGEITKPKSDGSTSLVLWYLDIDKRVAFSYCDPFEVNSSQYDGRWGINCYEYFTNEEVKREIKSMCKNKYYNSYNDNYSYSSSYNYSYNYSKSSYEKKEEIVYPKSELNKSDKDILTLV